MKDRKTAVELSIILLAAGSSSRMGQSKQLLVVDGEKLIRRAIHLATTVQPEKIIVVLGANEEQHRTSIQDLPVECVHNANWSTGIGSSIKAGLNHLLTIQPNTEIVIILVCDQPKLNTSHLMRLKEEYLRTGSPVVASLYQETIGVPALFEKSFFEKLLQLDDTQGARPVIQQNLSSLRTVPFPGGEIDLDTPHDYKNYMNSFE